MNEQSKPQLWLASNNAHKIKELAAMLPGVEIHTPKELAHCFSVEETGKSFAENAAIKARALFDLVGQPVISDDSGLEVKALNNGPGIYSSRYLGEQTDYAIKNQAIIEAVNGLGGSREARYVCALAYIDQTGNEQIFEGEMQGEIAKAPSGSNGFGYDPIFISRQFGLSNGDLDPALKNAHSHRAKALQAFLKAWQKQKEIEPKKAENQAKEPEQRGKGRKRAMRVHVVLYEPEIPGNTGNILRTCMAAGVKCHLIEPLGFYLDEKHLKRAGMDYITKANYCIHKSWQDFLEEEKPERMVFLSRYGKKNPKEVDFTQSDQDLYLIFGKESTGIDKAILKQHQEDLIRLPMIPSARSLNLSNTVAIMVYEVLGQLGYPGLAREEVLKGPDFLDHLEP